MIPSIVCVRLKISSEKNKIGSSKIMFLIISNISSTVKKVINKE